MSASFSVENGLLVVEDNEWGYKLELTRAELLELMEFVQTVDLEDLS